MTNAVDNLKIEVKQKKMKYFKDKNLIQKKLETIEGQNQIVRSQKKQVEKKVK